MNHPFSFLSVSVNFALVASCLLLESANAASTVIVSESFDTESEIGIFEQTSLASNFNWRWRENNFDGRFIEMNGFGADGPSDDWLILGTPLDLTPYANPNLSFKFIARFDGPHIEVLVSQDYDKGTHTDPADATWTAVDFFEEGEINEPDPNSWDAQFSDIISLEDFIGPSVSIALHYVSVGTESGDGAVWRIDDFVVSDSDPNAIILNAPLDLDIDPFSTRNQSGGEEWTNLSTSGRDGVFLDGTFDTEYNDDWLISPAMEISETDIPVISFDHYTDGNGPHVQVLVSTDYDPVINDDPTEATWTDLLIDFSDQEDDTWRSYSANSIYGFMGENVFVAFRYTSDVEENVPGRIEGIANFCTFRTDSVLEVTASVSTTNPQPTTGESVPFRSSVGGGKWPFTFLWDFGDGQTSTESQPSHAYENAGTYTVRLTVTDAENTSVVIEQADLITAINEENVFVKHNFEGAIDDEVPAPWLSYSAASDIDWHIDERSGRVGVVTRGFGADEPSEDWLISPPMEIGPNAIPVLAFDIHTQFEGPLLDVLVSTDYDPSANGDDPREATWSKLGIDLSGLENSTWTTISDVSLAGLTGTVYVAFKYVSLGTEDGQGRTYGIDEVQVLNADAVPPLSPLKVTASKTDATNEDTINFSALGTGGKFPYTYEWNFGDGESSSEPEPSHVYASPGTFSVTLTITDALGNQQNVTQPDLVKVIDAASVLLNLDIEGFDDDLVEEPWHNYSVLSSADWIYATFDGQQGAFINSFGADEESDDWLVSPEFTIADGEMGLLSFDFYSFFNGGGFEVLVSANYDPAVEEDPSTATWIPIDANFSSSDWSRITDSPVTVVGEKLRLAFHYTSTGTAAGDGRRIGVDNIQLIKTDAPVDENILLQTDFAGASGAPIAAPWTGFSVASDVNWRTDTRGERNGAIMNGIGADGPSDDWLISPVIDVGAAAFPSLSFDFYTQFLGPDLVVLASTDYDPVIDDDPASATWTDLLIDLSGATNGDWTTISPISLLGLSSENLVIAFKYTSTGEDAGQSKEIGIDNVVVEKAESAIALSSNFSISSTGVITTADAASFAPFANGGTRPYTFAWDFGDGASSTDASPSHQFETPGTYTVSLTIKDTDDNELAKSIPDLVTVLDAGLVLVLNDFGGADDSTIQLPWTSFSATSEAVWLIDTFDDQQGAFMNGFGTDDVSDDWLISPAFAVAADEIAVLTMDFYTFFEGGTFEILVSNDYDPVADEDPGSATWTAAEVDLSGEGWGTLTDVELPTVRGESVHLAFHYTSTGVAAGESRRIGLDNVVVLKAPAPEPETLTFAGWIDKNDYFEAGDPNGEPGADPDHDGLTNEVEFRFDLHPLQGYGFDNLPALTQQGETFMLTYQRIADGDNRWAVQFSSDLANWTDAEEGTDAQTEITDIGEPTDFLQTVNVVLTPSADQSHLYWRVALPAAD